MTANKNVEAIGIILAVVFVLVGGGVIGWKLTYRAVTQDAIRAGVAKYVITNDSAQVGTLFWVGTNGLVKSEYQ